MSLINTDRDKQILYETVVNLSENGSFINILNTDHGDNMPSYYIEKCPDQRQSYIMEYQFNTPVELKEELTKLWAAPYDEVMTHLIKCVQVPTFKLAPVNRGKHYEKNNKDLTDPKENVEYELPVFVYNF